MLLMWRLSIQNVQIPDSYTDMFQCVCHVTMTYVTPLNKICLNQLLVLLDHFSAGRRRQTYSRNQEGRALFHWEL